MILLWCLALLPPLALLAALALGGRLRHGAVRLAAIAPLCALPLAGAGPRAGDVDMPWLLLGTSLTLDAVGRPLLAVAALLYAAALASTAQVVSQRRPGFVAFLLVCWLGNAGVFLAADAATFYLSFTVMGFCAWGLVVHERTRTSLRAGRIYLILTVGGELALLSGLLLTVAAGGMHLADAPGAVAASPWRDAAVVLLVIGFGIKAGLMPLHVWLPLAHPAAPAPASAVLSGCMVKAGLVGLLRFLPLGEAQMPRAGAVLGGLALATAFLAIAAGLTQRDPKANLAYSTVSQMGIHLLLVGVALTSPDRAPAAAGAAVVYAAHHGLAKGALFLGVAVHAAYGGGRARHAVTAGLVLSALAVAGAPLTAGAAAKYSAKEAAGDAAIAGIGVAEVLPFIAVGSTLLLARFLLLLRPGAGAPVRPGRPGLFGSWAAVVLVGVPMIWLLIPGWVPDAPGASAGWPAFRTAFWPVALGLALSVAGHRLFGRRPVLQIPPGDVVVLLERCVRPTVRAAGKLGKILRPPRPAVRVPGTSVAAIEERLISWRTSGAAVLGVLACFVLIAGLR